MGVDGAREDYVMSVLGAVAARAGVGVFFASVVESAALGPSVRP